MWSVIKGKYINGDGLTRLLFINVVVFIVLTVYNTLFGLMNSTPPSFLGEDLMLAATANAMDLIKRPWSVLTYMFTHLAFGHFLFNMIGLLFLGAFFRDRLGSKKLVSTYILGGLAGFLLFFIAFNIFPAFSHNASIVGASAGIMAITLTLVTLYPDMYVNVWGVLKLKFIWLGIIIVLLDLSSIRSGVNSGGHIGHIGGAAFGFFYGWQLKKGSDMTSWFGNFLDKIKGLFSKKRMTVTVNQGRPKSDYDFNLEKKARQQKVDEILDKIGRSGYDSLSRDEKDFLFRNSQK
jgi:membrane associated rhomboid family serine protease